MDLKNKNISAKWAILAALLAVTLWFPSTREAQTLCLRWLSGWHNHAYVRGFYGEGSSWDYLVYEAPNVHFTPEFVRELKNHSTNSLIDFARATGIGESERNGGYQLRFPQVETAWTNSPLLPWVTLQMAQRAIVAAGTNPMSSLALHSILPLMHLAQKTDPGNGAFWQAEAAVDFAAGDNASALEALWTAASLTNWNAGSTSAFNYLSQLYKQAGLSELDASSQALGETCHLPVQGEDWDFIQTQMVQAVSQGRPEQFAKLLQLLVELRRIDWSDHYSEIRNVYRYFSPNDDLIAAMAVALKINLATNEPSDFDHYKQEQIIRQQIFPKYLSRYADPVTVATFTSQTGFCKTESRLRGEIMGRDARLAGLWFELCNLTGMCTLLLLSGLVAALMFKVVSSQVKSQTGRPAGQWPRDQRFWVPALIFAVAYSTLTGAFLHACEIHDENDFEVSYFLSLPMLTLFCGALLFLASAWRFQKQADEVGNWLLGCKFWVLSLMLMAVCSFKIIDLSDLIMLDHRTYLEFSSGFVLSILAAICLGLMLKVFRKHRQNRATQTGKWPRDGRFWTLLLAAIVFCSVLWANFSSMLMSFCGSNSDFPEFITPVFWVAALWAFVFFAVAMICLLQQWKSGRPPVKSWSATRFLVAAYLISVMAMAYCRSQWVAENIRMYH